MKSILWFCLLFSVFGGVLSAQDVTGEWLGKLKAGPVEMNLSVKITKTPTGSLKASMSIPEQGDSSVTISSVSLEGTAFKFTIDNMRASYEGVVDFDANTISGTWSQGITVPLNFHRDAPPKPAALPTIDGTWAGILDFGALKLHIVYHLLTTPDGLTATADSPDQGAKDMPAIATRDGASLKLELKKVNAVFTGKIAADLQSITGTFVQGANNVPLVLTPLKDASQLEHHRPQDPVRPFPYREEDVSYDNKTQNVHLAATFTFPNGKGPFPAVLLITGSGPQDRDETLMGHHPFLVLSDYLTRHGIAVLRVDDRGVGKSTGKFSTATSADFATDVEASFAYLKSRPEVNPRKLGLVGHSEGGIIAPMLAARNPDIAFIVLMAGTGVRGDEVLVAQSAAIQESLGASHAEAEKNAAVERQFLALVSQEKDDAVLQRKMRELTAGKMSDEQITANIEQIRSPWFQYFLQYDPAPALRKVTCPVLVLNGAKDTQVIPSQNLPAIRKALESGGNRHFEIVELPGLNHLFQTAKTGSPSEYADIDETLAPIAMEKISSWILKQ